MHTLWLWSIWNLSSFHFTWNINTFVSRILNIREANTIHTDPKYIYTRTSSCLYLCTHIYVRNDIVSHQFKKLTSIISLVLENQYKTGFICARSPKIHSFFFHNAYGIATYNMKHRRKCELYCRCRFYEKFMNLRQYPMNGWMNIFGAALFIYSHKFSYSYFRL